MNETSTGIAIVESGIPRDQLFICTKIATGLKDGKVAENFKSQLAKLQVSYVDLLLIHWPFELGANGFPAHEEAWKSLEALKDAGLARSIGVSNYRIADLQRTLAVAKHKVCTPIPNSDLLATGADEAQISVNQIEMHPYVLKESKALLAFMAKHEIVCEAYAPTASLNKFPGGSFTSRTEYADHVQGDLSMPSSRRSQSPSPPAQKCRSSRPKSSSSTSSSAGWSLSLPLVRHSSSRSPLTLRASQAVANGSAGRCVRDWRAHGGRDGADRAGRWAGVPPRVHAPHGEGEELNRLDD